MKNIPIRIILIILIISGSLTVSKAADLQVDDTPECIQNKILEEEAILFQVIQWEINGELFYLFSYLNCYDCFEYLYNENCEYVCAPSGGISGQGNFDCPDWNGTITETILWKDLVWPGDFNTDGIVDNQDIIYWVIAEGLTGPTRPNASLTWSPQACNGWSSSVNNINSKHQDGNGDGIVDINDLDALIQNYGNTQDSYIPASQAPSSDRYRLQLVSSIKSDSTITNTYELYVETFGIIPHVYAHGLACSMYFEGLPLIDASVDVSNSSLMPHEHFAVFDATQNRLDLALTRTDNNNQPLDGPVASIVTMMEDLQSIDPLFFAVHIDDNGSMMSANGVTTPLSGSTMSHGLFDDGLVPTDDFFVGVSVAHEGCNTLGSATVQTLGGTPPFTYAWSTDETTNAISDLISGAYSITVSDATGLSITIPFIVYGQVPVYAGHGEVICEGSICPDYLMEYGYIPPDVSYHADIMLDSDGIVLDGINVEFKAGQTMVNNIPSFKEKLSTK